VKGTTQLFRCLWWCDFSVPRVSFIFPPPPPLTAIDLLVRSLLTGFPITTGVTLQWDYTVVFRCYIWAVCRRVNHSQMAPRPVVRVMMLLTILILLWRRHCIIFSL
jgi:hypothetical protein